MPVPPSGDSSLGAAFEGRMRVSCVTRYTCPVCGDVKEVERGLLEQGAQIKRCNNCGGKGAQAWGGPPDEMKE